MQAISLLTTDIHRNRLLHALLYCCIDRKLRAHHLIQIHKPNEVLRALVYIVYKVLAHLSDILWVKALKTYSNIYGKIYTGSNKETSCSIRTCDRHCSCTTQHNTNSFWDFERWTSFVFHLSRVWGGKNQSNKFCMQFNQLNRQFYSNRQYCVAHCCWKSSN